MQQIEYLRGTLEQRLETERKNRAEYESIVLTLLDKTCSQGEHLLRRICWWLSTMTYKDIMINAYYPR